MMKNRFLVLTLALIILFVASAFGSADVGPEETPDPEACGVAKVFEVSGPYQNDYFKVSYNGDYLLEFESYNGWDLGSAIVSVPGGTPFSEKEFPNDSTEGTMDLTGKGFKTSEINVIMVGVERRCSVCKPTDHFVYTLVGNYPCNLVTTEKSIPARFLNPDYIGPLCSLPGVQFSWTGGWIKSKVENCGSYEVGGNHYNTSKP